MDHNLEGLEEYGVNVDLGIEYTGNRDKFIAAIERFCKSYETNRSRITDDLNAMNVDDYTIAVHALKSNSKMIGAGELSSRFEALELAGKAGNKTVIINDTQIVLDTYELLVTRLKQLVTTKEASSAEIIYKDTALKVSGDLLGALDEYDDELSSSLVLKLSGYSFGPAERELLDKAVWYIGEFMYDEAAEIIRQISGTIE